MSDPTSSAASVEGAMTVLDLCCHTPLTTGTGKDQQGACQVCIALALDAARQAGAREAR